METTTCLTCGANFVPPKRNPTQQHCSIACSRKRPRPHVIKTCESCGAEFKVWPSHADTRFCSLACRCAKIEKTCIVCGASFSVDRSVAHKRKTCSNKCKYELKTAKTRAARTRTCPVCQTEFMVPAQNYSKTYCSAACFGKAHQNRIIKTCERCGKEFDVNAARSNARFCSKTCVTDQIEKTCANCGQTFQVKRSHTAKRNTCSKTCAAILRAKEGRSPRQNQPQSVETRQKVSAGLIRYFNGDPSKHSNFKNGPFSQRRGVHNKWEAAKQQARAKSAYCCAVCGVSESTLGKRLSVHHIKPFRLFADSDEANQPDNLIAVCQPCHMKLERGSIALTQNAPLPQLPLTDEHNA